MYPFPFILYIICNKHRSIHLHLQETFFCTPASKHGLFKSKFPLYSPPSLLITHYHRKLDILHTIHNQGDVCELVKLSLFVQFVQHDFVVRREHASTLHLPHPLSRHDPRLPSLREPRKMIQFNNDLKQ